MSLDLEFWLSLVGLFSFLVLIGVVIYGTKGPQSSIWSMPVLIFISLTLGVAIFFVVESLKTENFGLDWLSLVGLFSFLFLIGLAIYRPKKTPSSVWSILVSIFTLLTLGVAIYFVVESSKTENPSSENNTTEPSLQYYNFGVTISASNNTGEISDTGINLVVNNNFENNFGYSFVKTTSNRRRELSETIFLLSIFTDVEPDSSMSDTKRWNCLYFFEQNISCTHSFQTNKISPNDLPKFPSRKHEYKKVPYQKSSMSENHECKIENAMVLCRGKNDQGQLGISSNVDTQNFVKVPNLQNIIALATGFAHTCALRRNRTVVCWGRNVEGQLGIEDNTQSTFNTPVNIKDLTDVVELTTGLFHTCCLVNNIKLFCWGANNHGQLGLNQTNNTNSPTRIKGYGDELTPFSFIRHIEAGGNVTCLLRSHKKAHLHCTGNNEYGQLGTNISDSLSTIFGQVYQNIEWIWQRYIHLFKIGSKHVCAFIRIQKNETFLNCWGTYTNKTTFSAEKVQLFENTDVIDLFKKNTSICVKVANSTDSCL